MSDMYKCVDCGKIFKVEDSKVVEECVGEFWGQPAYERWDACPNCSSQNLEEYKGVECWVSFYLNDGTQSGATLTVKGDDIYDEIEEQLIEEYGEDFGGIADYDTYENMIKEA